MIQGRIHSIETCGTVDGPGIRYVIFTQGCSLNCLYCHNPDTQSFTDGKLVSVDELIVDIKKYSSYINFSNGGVTISGGEPTLQPEFVTGLLSQCKELGIHTALDTSGVVSIEVAKKFLPLVDLVLLDIKAFDEELHKELTGVALAPVLQFARYLHDIKKPTWIRYVLVPGWTDNTQHIQRLGEFISTLHNVEKVEVLPFHKLGEFKWELLCKDYKLKDTPLPSEELIRETERVLCGAVAK